MKISLTLFIILGIFGCSTSPNIYKARYPSSKTVILSKETCSRILGTIANFSLKNNTQVDRLIYEQAYAHNISEYQKKIRVLESFKSTYAADKLLISKINRSHVSVSHMIVLLINRADEFAKSLEYFKADGFPEINLYIEKLQNNIKIRHFERVKLDSFDQKELARRFTNTDTQRDILDLVNRPYAGHIGELDYFFRLNKVIDSNIIPGNKLENKDIEEIFKNALESLRDRLEIANLEGKGKHFKQDFPAIFSRVKWGKRHSRIQKVNNLIKWLKDKEFDLVRELTPTKWQIVEVKNYENLMTYEKFTEKRASGKSLLDQQLENLEILKLLQIEDSFSNAIVFRNGCSPEVKELLEKLNIKVLTN